jgi:hypothetical protein
MSHAFLSYSRRDAPLVDTIAKEMERQAIKTWVDRRGIGGGEQWRREIVGAIQSAGVLVLFMSPHSMKSGNVRKELDIAESAKVKVLPVAIAPIDIPKDMQYQLAGVQIIELWRDRDNGLLSLIRAVERTAGSGAAKGKKPKPARMPVRAQGADLSELGGGRLLSLITFGWLRRKRSSKP